MQKTTRNSMVRLLQYCGIFVLTLVLSIMMTASIFAADESTAKGSYTTPGSARYLANGSTVTGKLTSSDLVDWYRISVPSKQRVKLTYTTGVYDSTFELFNSSNTSDYIHYKNVYYVSEGSTQTYVYDETLSAGTYYIRIKPWSTKTYTGSYKISFAMPNYTASGLVAPGGLKVTGKDYKSVKVSWNKVNNVSGYHLYVSNTLNGYYKKCATVKKNTQTSVTLTNLVPGKSYYFKIQTYKGNGKSAFSGRKYGKTKESYANITSLTTSGTTATLKWNKVSGAHAYHILRAKGNGSFTDIKTVSSSTFSFKNTGLAQGTQYRYSIRVSYLISGKYYLGTRSSAKSITTYAPAKYRALLIGESDYSNAYGAGNLNGPVYDVDVMQKVLGGMKTKYSVVKKKNATRSQIMNAISSTYKGAKSNDVSLFYYSGHGDNGYSSRTGALYPVDGNDISPAELANALKKVPGKVIVIIDACGSGAMVKDSSNNTSSKAFTDAIYNAFAAADASTAKSGELATGKFVVIAACDKYETSQDATTGSGYAFGVMTYFLAGAAGYSYPNGSYSGSMPGDTNNNGRLTVAELYRYIDNGVRSFVSNYNFDYQTTTVYPSKTSGYNVLIRK